MWNTFATKTMFILCIYFNHFSIIVICPIENVTKDDIIRVVQKILTSPLTMVARGDISKLPQLEEIQEFMNTKPKGLFRHF